MKKYLLILCPLLAFGKLPPTQAEAQAHFDRAVAAADHAKAEYISFDSSTGDESLSPIWESHSRDEISMLTQYFRLEVPPPERRVIDGEEVLSYKTFRCGCRGEFIITLRKENENLLSFGFTHGEHIGSVEILKNSAIRIDRNSAAPFYSMLVDAAKKLEAKKGSMF